jgi:hypothetical protein
MNNKTVIVFSLHKHIQNCSDFFQISVFVLELRENPTTTFRVKGVCQEVRKDLLLKTCKSKCISHELRVWSGGHKI